MSAIRGKNTKPELLIRTNLHRLGFRYRLHYSKLPGKPDIVLPKYKAVILVNGCFWHLHSCHLFKWPKNNREFWEKKLLENQERDVQNRKKFGELGWKVLIVWECAIKGRAKLPLEKLVGTINKWLVHEKESKQISGVNL